MGVDNQPDRLESQTLDRSYPFGDIANADTGIYQYHALATYQNALIANPAVFSGVGWAF